MSRMEQDEEPDSIHFPENGVRATDITPTKLTVNGNQGLLEIDQEQSQQLSDDLSTASMSAIRSVVIFHDLDIKVEGIHNSAQYYQAGWTPLEGIPETSKFTVKPIDTNIAGHELKPKSMNFEVFVFNTDYVQFDPEGKKKRISKSNEDFSVSSTTYEDAMLVPASPYSQERFKINNKGGANLDARLKTLDAGTESTEVEVTDISDFEPFDKLPSADFYLIQLKKSGSTDTTADIIFRGETE